MHGQWRRFTVQFGCSSVRVCAFCWLAGIAPLLKNRCRVERAAICCCWCCASLPSFATLLHNTSVRISFWTVRLRECARAPIFSSHSIRVDPPVTFVITWELREKKREHQFHRLVGYPGSQNTHTTQQHRSTRVRDRGDRIGIESFHRVRTFDDC